jgi:hypothetical protein
VIFIHFFQILQKAYLLIGNTLTILRSAKSDAQPTALTPRLVTMETSSGREALPQLLSALSALQQDQVCTDH